MMIWGLKLLDRGDDDPLDRRVVAAVAGARRERNVDAVAGARALAGVLDQPRAGREEPVLVQGDRQHAGVVVEGVLGAVAVVDVPVDDRDPLEAVDGAHVLDRDRDVGEDAEAAAFVALGVVAGRPVQRVGVVDVAVPDRLDRLDHAARRERADAVAAGAEGRQFAAVAAAFLAFALDPREVLGGVDAEDLLLGRLAPVERGHLAEQAGDVEDVAQAPLGRRALTVLLGLDQAAGRHVARPGPGVVPGIELVPVEAGRHRQANVFGRRAPGRPI